MRVLFDNGKRARQVTRADSWYTGDFEEAFQDILEGCEAMLDN